MFSMDIGDHIELISSEGNATATASSRGSIPIYRRGYGSRARGGPPVRTLVWEDGRLKGAAGQPLTETSSTVTFVPFPEAASAKPISAVPGVTVGIPRESGGFSMPPLSFAHPPRGCGRRAGRPRGRGRGRGNWRRTDSEMAPIKLPEVEMVLPQPPPREVLPTDFNFPTLSLAAEDPLLSSEALELPIDLLPDPMGPSSNLPPGTSSKMKSSGIDEFDIDTLKHYPKLNGYTLFTLSTKKKYGYGDDARDQKSLNRRWQAMWNTLPERERTEWKQRARRALKQIELAADRTKAAEAKRANGIKRVASQLTRTSTTKYTLVDIAAHFKLLADSFTRAAELMGDYRGPVAMDSVESTLLDGLLTCLIPLTAIAGELEPLAGVPDKHDVCAGLSTLAHIFPVV